MKMIQILLLSLCSASLFFASDSALDRSKPPKLSDPVRFKPHSIQSFKLDNGLEVLFYPKSGVPLLHASLLVKSGTIHEPASKLGLTALMTEVMNEGAGTRNALEFADAVDFLGATLSTSWDRNHVNVSLHTPISKFDEALALMSDLALRPRFEKAEFERKRNEALTILLQNYDEPVLVGAQVAYAQIFGKDHPYGRPSLGNQQTLNGLAETDLSHYHREIFKAGNAVLIVAGEIEPGLLKTKLQAAFGAMPSGTLEKAKPAATAQLNKRRVLLVDKPEAAQTVVRIGYMGIESNHPDRFALAVMNTVLGGSFASRLNQNLRETHGYTYGARSHFTGGEMPGPFFASASVQTAVTDKALVEFFKELEAIRKGVTDEELARAKNYLALQFPNDFQTCEAIVHRIANLVLEGFPMEELNQYVDRIMAVSSAEVTKAATKYIEPKRMLVVLVGDKAKIEAGVAALKLGPLTHQGVEEALGPKPKL